MKNERYINTINWCRYVWETCMENGRPIHPEYPWYYMDSNQVRTFNSEVHLYMQYKPQTISWYNKEWTEKVDYHPSIACGLIRSKNIFTVNSSFECDVMMPAGNNLWFSFWLTACDAWPPEIDIFEGYTDKKGSYYDRLAFHWQFPFLYRNVRVESNVHYKDNGINRQAKPKGVHSRYFNHKIQSQWNHFKCTWKENIIAFSINDVVVRTITDMNILSRMKTKGMWVIFNVWPNDSFDLSEYGDITTFSRPFIIKNFKAKKI